MLSSQSSQLSEQESVKLPFDEGVCQDLSLPNVAEQEWNMSCQAAIAIWWGYICQDLVCQMLSSLGMKYELNRNLWNHHLMGVDLPRPGLPNVELSVGMKWAVKAGICEITIWQGGLLNMSSQSRQESVKLPFDGEVDLPTSVTLPLVGGSWSAIHSGLWNMSFQSRAG